MTDLDQIARRAGTELRGWAPVGPDDVPAAAMAARVRRRRAGRSVAGVAVGALVVVAGIGLAGGSDRPDSTVVPADGGDPAPTTTALQGPTTTVEAGPVDSADPSPLVPTGDPYSDEDFIELCAVELAGGGSMHVLEPSGWSGNYEVPETDGVPGVPGCQVFGPGTVELGDPQLPDGWSSNGPVAIVPEPVAGFGPAGSWEQYLTDRSAAPPAERRVVAGQPALREELSENGEPWLRWTFLLGDTVVTATATASVDAGVTYERAAAVLDEMVSTVRYLG